MKSIEKVYEQDGKLWIEIPDDMVRSINLKEGQVVRMEIINGGILVTPSAYGWMAGTAEQIGDIVSPIDVKWNAESLEAKAERASKEEVEEFLKGDD